jgi:uroporphyrinogen decarboxylase
MREMTRGDDSRRNREPPREAAASEDTPLRVSSRELVLAAFGRIPQARVPKWFGSSPEFIAKACAELGLPREEELRLRLGDDFRRVFSSAPPSKKSLSPGATWASPFGVERTGLFYGEPMSHPLAESLTMEALDAYPWPDPDLVDVSSIRGAIEKWGGRYAILGGEWSPFWHDAIDLVGMENLLLLMYDDPPFVDALLDRIDCYYLAASEKVFREAGDLIDIYFIGNDFGSQKGPLIGPGLFDRFLAPHLARHAELGHAYGLAVMLHCCGGIRELIPSIAAAGIDALHALQPDCAGMDTEGIKRDFGGMIVLNGGIDSRRVLIEGNPESVRAATRAVLDIMAPCNGATGGPDSGAYIAGASHDYILPETPVENVLAMFDEIEAYRRPGDNPPREAERQEGAR